MVRSVFRYVQHHGPSNGRTIPWTLAHGERARRTPARHGLLTALLLAGWTLAQAADPATLLCLGDSLTAGYGLAPQQAWPALLNERIQQEGLPWRVVNAGLSGDTSAGGLRRLDWLLGQPVQVLVLALGANDGLRGTPPEETERNLRAIVEKARARYPEVTVVLAGMQMPPNLGPDFTAAFRALYPRLARELNLTLWPFMLEGVAGRPELHLPDEIHPNAEGQRLLAEQAWLILQPLLRPAGATPSADP